MPGKVTVKEYTLQQGFVDNLFPVTYGSWSSFMDTYAAWDNAQGNSITIRRSVSLPAGYYYVIGAADNSGSVTINQYTNVTLYSFNTPISRTDVATNTRIYHSGGPMSIQIQAANAGTFAPGNPRGVAVTISEEISQLQQFQYIGNYQPTYSVGNLVWSTRTNMSTIDNGRYTVEIPFSANITAHAWGAGGGGGGNDAGTIGGLGSPGLYNTTTFQVDNGDVLEVFVGRAGRGGASNDGGAPGGAAGSSRISIDGDSTKSFNGGAGSAAGPRPYSGGGGGGGGASGILVNNTPVLIAAGGGGGGGAGNDGNSAGTYARRDASISKNAIGAAGSDYRGENGQIKDGDGGGAGAGGGGYPGGRGGAINTGDSSASAGQCGGNFPVYSATMGTNTPYYKSGFAGGGDRGSGNGQNGRVVLVIEPVGSQAAVKVGGSWKQIEESYTKIDGNWKLIDSVFIKIGNNWQSIDSTGAFGDFNLSLTDGFYATVNRPYS